LSAKVLSKATSELCSKAAEASSVRLRFLVSANIHSDWSKTKRPLLIHTLWPSFSAFVVDIWDGDSVSLEPQIYHGRTFTSKVSVRAVVHAIGKYAFVASPYPVILSAEIHCGVEQQDRLVQILEEVLGDRFLGKKLDGWEEGEEELPSPEMLKYKILLKVRRSGLLSQ
jgi:phosphatidylinositol phospholipase C delta